MLGLGVALTACSLGPADAGGDELPRPNAHWTFDVADVVGTSVHDVTGNGHEGVVHGSLTYNSGIVGDKCVTFPGPSTGLDFIQVPASPALCTSSITLMFWLRNCPIGNYSFLSQGDGSVSGVRVLYSNGASYWVATCVTTAGVVSALYNTTSLSGAHHIAATFNEFSSPNWLFYVDGVAQTLITPLNFGSNRPIIYGGDNLFIGGQDAGGGAVGGAVIGDMDGVQIYPRVLSAAEIASIAAAIPIDLEA